MSAVWRKTWARFADGRGVAAGAVTSILVRFAGALTTLIAMPIALRTLGELRFGTFLLLFGIVNWINLGSLGLHSALGRAIASNSTKREELPDYLGAAFLCAALSTIVIALIVSAGFEIWLVKVGSHQHVPVNEVQTAAYILMALITLQITLQVFEGVQTGHLRFYMTNLTRLAGSIFAFAGLLILPRLWPSMSVFVIAINGGLVVGSILNAAIVLRDVRPRFSEAVRNIRRFLPLMTSGLSFFAVGIASLLQTNVPVFILASFHGPVSAIDFGLFIRLLVILITAMTTITTPLWPALLRARVDADHTWIKKSLLWAALMVVGLGAVSGLTLAFFGKHVIFYWTGRHLVEPNAFKYLFGLYFLQMAWSHYWATVLFGMGRERLVSLSFIVEGALMIVFGTLFSIHGGAVGMIAGLVLAFALVTNWFLPFAALTQLRRLDVDPIGDVWRRLHNSLRAASAT